MLQNCVLYVITFRPLCQKHFVSMIEYHDLYVSNICALYVSNIVLYVRLICPLCAFLCA